MNDKFVVQPQNVATNEERPSQQHQEDTFKVQLNDTEKSYLGVIEKAKAGEEVDPRDLPDIHAAPEESAPVSDPEPAVDEKLTDDQLDSIISELVAGKEIPESKPEVKVTNEQVPNTSVNKGENTDSMTSSERQEYLQMKADKVAAEESKAFLSELDGVDDAELAVIAPTITAIISGEGNDKFLDQLEAKGLPAQQRAQLVVKEAQRRNDAALKEIRTKAEEARQEQAHKENKVQEVVKELIATPRNGSLDAPTPNQGDLMERFRQGDEDARAAVLLGDDMKNFGRRR